MAVYFADIVTQITQNSKDNCHNYDMTTQSTCIYLLSLTARLNFPVEAVCLIELGKEFYRFKFLHIFVQTMC